MSNLHSMPNLSKFYYHSSLSLMYRTQKHTYKKYSVTPFTIYANESDFKEEVWMNKYFNKTNEMEICCKLVADSLKTCHDPN